VSELNSGSIDNHFSTCSGTAQGYVLGSLYYLPYIDGSTNIGLTGGTLYDVPKTNAATGTITVNATGFNVTCEFLEDLSANFGADGRAWRVSSRTMNLGVIESTRALSGHPIPVFLTTSQNPV
jgi:hypothetical protein